MKILTLGLGILLFQGAAYAQKGTSCEYADRYVGIYKGACEQTFVLFHYENVSEPEIKKFEGELRISMQNSGCKFKVETLEPIEIIGFSLARRDYLFEGSTFSDFYKDESYDSDGRLNKLEILKREGEGFDFSYVRILNDGNPLLYTDVINTVLTPLNPYSMKKESAFSVRIDSSFNDNSGAQFNFKVICKELKRVGVGP